MFAGAALFAVLVRYALAVEPAANTHVAAFYRPKGTWWETTVASREAFMEQDEAAGRFFLPL